jgi:uncharacterized membrane protein
MPAVNIRILVSLEVVVEATTTSSQREVLLRQGEMVLSSAQESVTDQNDLDDIQGRFVRLTESVAVRNEG